MATAEQTIGQGPGTDGDDYGLHGDPPWLDVDWRNHLRQAEVRGSQLNYVEVGEGPPIVLIHGLSGCWQNWLENIPYFAASHRVIAIDLPGFGNSQMPRDPISIRFYGEFVDAALEKLGVERATLVGNSMGGFVATEVSISFPSRVDRMVLVSAAGVHDLPSRASPTQIVRAAGLMRPLTAAAIKRARFLAARARGRRMLLGMVCRYPERIRPQMCLEMIAGANKPAFGPALTDLLTYDFRHRLESVGAPTLIVWGRNDLVIPVRNADLYERSLKDSEKIILEQTGHVAMIERARTFNRLVGDFVSR